MPMQLNLMRFEQKADNGGANVPSPSENLFSICFLTLLFQEMLRMPPKKKKLSAREVEALATRSDSSHEPSPPQKLARTGDRINPWIKPSSRHHRPLLYPRLLSCSPDCRQVVQNRGTRRLSLKLPLNENFFHPDILAAGSTRMQLLQRGSHHQSSVL